MGAALTPHEAIDRINAAFGKHTPVRSLHAKGSFYAGTFTATARAGELCRPAHLSGAPVPAVVRFSNGAGRKSADKVPDVRGLAVSLRVADGAATDILGQTSPRFPVRTPEEFVAFTLAAVAATRNPLKLAAFVATHPRVLPALVANAKAGALKPPRSYAAATYYAIHAFRWLDAAGGACWVRYTWRPDPSSASAAEPDRADPDYLRSELERRLERGPVRLTLQVQVAAAGDDPHDPTSVWKGAEVFDAGTLEITAPDPERETGDEVIVFDPTRVIDGIELSDDPILRFRPLAYSVSVERRA